MQLYPRNTYTQSMDARQQDYPQSGLSSPYPTFPDSASEGTSADQASAAQYPPQGQDPRASNLTPSSDYSINPSSARSGSFPEYIQRSYQPGAQGQAPGGMAQQQSPSMPLSDGHSGDHQQPQLKSDSDVPIDPSIAAATSPTYPHQQQYSPYTPHHDMQHYPGHPQTPMYASRPEWAGQYPQPGMHYGHPATSGPPAPAMVSPVQRPPTVSHPISGFYNVSSSKFAHARVNQDDAFNDAYCHSTLFCFVNLPWPVHVLTQIYREVILFLLSILLCQFQARSSTRDRAGAMRKLSACTSVAGMAARRHTERSTI